MEQLLRSSKMKITKGRLAILAVLNENSKAITVEDIFNKCKSMNNTIDLSTVYRILELFFEKRIVDRFDLGDSKYGYVLKQEDHKHYLRCKTCENIIEIDCPIKQLQQIIKNNTGFTIEEKHLHLDLEGICEKCTKK